MYPGMPICKNVQHSFARYLCEEVIMRDTAVFIVIEGMAGDGKSTLALKLCYHLLGDWEKVMQSIVFNPFDLKKKIDYALEKGIIYPCIVWDDSGPWWELVKRYPYDPFSLSLIGHVETMRTWVKVFINTMLTEKHLPRAVADNGHLYRYKIKVRKIIYDKQNQTWVSRATVYRRYEGYNDKWLWDRSSPITFTFRLFKKGHPVYEEYAKMRHDYVRFYNRFMEEAKKVGRLSQVVRIMEVTGQV